MKDLINNLRKKYIRKKYQLTPSGECLKKYLEEKANGSTDSIDVYDEVFYALKEIVEKENHIELTDEEAIAVINIFFEEYFS